MQAIKNYRRIEQIIPSHWVEGSLFANGIHHHYYRTGGDKPPLVMLHGFLEGALTWLHTARTLEEDYDLILVDARGHGKSDRIISGFSQSLLTADVAGVMRALSLSSARIIGHSQGGTTGIHLAAEYPELVHSLVVEGWGDYEKGINTDFTNSPGYQSWYAAYLNWLEQLKLQTHEERLLSALSQLPPGSPFLPEDEYVPWVENCANLDLDLVKLGAELWSGLGDRVHEMLQALQQIICPVLILKSSFFPEPGATLSVDEEASPQPNVHIIHFNNTGHLIHREQPDQFLLTVKDFFARS